MAQNAPVSPEAPLVEVRATPSGFLGAFAARDISRGTLVVEDKPLFTIDAPLQAYLFSRAQSGASGGPTPVEGEEEEEPAQDLDVFLDRNIHTVLSWKTDEQRRAFWDLANTRPDLPPAQGIFATNAIQTSGETGGLFPLLSRLNSSCRPTLSRPAWDPSTGTIRLYAMRDIAAGEELTWTYLNVTYEFEGVDARRDEMRRVFDFECACPACGPALSDEELRESERRLLRLRRLRECLSTNADVNEEERESRRVLLRRMAVLAREEQLWATVDRLEHAIQDA